MDRDRPFSHNSEGGRLNKPLQVVLDGKGAVTLRPNDHIATGGEGSIYRVGDLAVKMYLEPDKMRAAGMPEKIKALAGLVHRFVVGPRGLVLNATADPIGHYLPFVGNGHPLSMVFTNEFWTQESFGSKQAIELVDGMRAAVGFAHQCGATLVDANELNWMAVLDGNSEPRVIDVDSWAIGKWPASVIMPSIRDWNSKTFDDESDWFSWAIVTFQVFTGLHPYKGTLPGFDRGDLVGRMKARASVFSPGVRMNRAVREFSDIPAALLRWYEAVFQGAERSAPPSPYDKAVTAAPAARKSRTVLSVGGGKLSFDRLGAQRYDQVVRVFFCGAVATASGNIHDLNAGMTIAMGLKGAEVVRVDGGWLVGHKSGFRYVPENGSPGENLTVPLLFSALLSYENRIFAVTDKGLSEIQVKVFGKKPIAAIANTWSVLTNSTRWFSGMGVQDAIGAMYLVLPFGTDSVSCLRVPALDGLKVVAGKAGYRFISVVATDSATGIYQKIEFTLNRDYTIQAVWRGPHDGAGLNVAILPKGVCATILKDGELDLFVPASGAVRRVEDRQVATDMALCNWGDKVLFIHNGEVWWLQVK